MNDKKKKKILFVLVFFSLTERKNGRRGSYKFLAGAAASKDVRRASQPAGTV